MDYHRRKRGLTEKEHIGSDENWNVHKFNMLDFISFSLDFRPTALRIDLLALKGRKKSYSKLIRKAQRFFNFQRLLQGEYLLEKKFIA